MLEPGLLTWRAAVQEGPAPPTDVTAERGSARVALRVGGLTVVVETAVAGLLLKTEGCATRFQISSGVADLSLRAEWRVLNATSPGRLVFDSGCTWRLYEHEDRQAYRLFAPQFGPVPYQEVWIEPDGATGTVYVNPQAYPPQQPVDVLGFPLDELLFLRLLAAEGGAELHACGVVTPSGQGLLFAGQSGDGKTTTARLWAALPGVEVLSDDRIVVRCEAGRWWMYGTPWHGEAELASTARAPLTAVFLLAHGASNRLEPLSQAQAVSMLLARSFVALHDANAIGATVEALAGLVGARGGQRFSFAPRPDAVQTILACVEGL